MPSNGQSPRFGAPAGAGPSAATRWGMWVARRRWWMLGAWGVLLVASALAYPHLMSSLVASDYSVTGSDSARVSQLMGSEFAAGGAEQDVIAFDSGTRSFNDGDYRDTVDRVVRAVRDQPGVSSLLAPTDPGAQQLVSKDGRAALALLGISGNDRERGDRAKDLQDVVQQAAGDGPVNAYLTGYSPAANDLTDVENADVERAESVGVPVAFVVLLLALGAVVAAFVPLATALTSLMATFGLLSLLTLVRTFDAFLVSIVTMIGVGVAIDYSLFIISRYREELVRARRDGEPDPVARAVGLAMTTSGRTIAFSGALVIVALFSLFVVNAPLFRGIALGAVLVVACTLVTAWTMLPALLAALGDRVNAWGMPRRLRPAENAEDDTGKPNFWARWARTVLDHPWLAGIAAALLILFSIPTLGLKLGIDLGMSSVADTPSGQGNIVLTRSFSPGLLSPTEVLATHDGNGPLTQHDLTTIDEFSRSLQQDPRVDRVVSISTVLRDTEGEVTTAALSRAEDDPALQGLVGQTVNLGKGSNRTIVTVVTASAVDSTDAQDLIGDLRETIIPGATADGGPQMLVGGTTAQFDDLGDEALGKLPLVMVLVLSLSFLYLLVIFRSLVLPLKAVVMNLLATAAAFGLVTWVFQDGHLESVFGFTSVGFIQTYLPIMVFALLFGLSMDYEVFLIRRMQEEWLSTHDNEQAVVVGLAHTARPIVAAATIMAAVFGCFLLADVLELKQFGFGLAVAVVLDATLVRLLLVPAVMKLAGNANWWLPGWLDRRLPRVRLD